MAAILRDCVYGLAVGDALGVPYEFMPRGSFTCTGMAGYGTHMQPAGTWSDDTSMALALCDSIRACGRVDVDDMRGRFCDWFYGGAYTVDGVFDFGGATARALESGVGCSGERDNGNGSLMRTLPLAFVEGVGRREVGAVSAITHAHPISRACCVDAVEIAKGLAAGIDDIEAFFENFDFTECYRDYSENIAKKREVVRSGGYVVDTLNAAIWCLLHTDSYAECVLEAVNLGDDTDTTAAVAGGLAGIVYGYDGIPREWLAALRGRDVIEACLF